MKTRILPLTVLLISGACTIFAIATWYARANLPYNEQGRYFDGLVVYDAQSVDIYVALAVLNVILTLSAAYWLRRAFRSSRAKPNKTSDRRAG